MSIPAVEFRCLPHQQSSLSSNYGSFSELDNSDNSDRRSKRNNNKQPSKKLNSSSPSSSTSSTISTSPSAAISGKIVNNSGNRVALDLHHISEERQQEQVEGSSRGTYDVEYNDPLAPPAMRIANHEIPASIAAVYQLIDNRRDSFITTTSDASSSYSGEDYFDSATGPSYINMLIAGSAANLCSATLGAGVLALPYALYQSGIILGGFLLIGSAIATIFSIDLLVTACHVYSIYSYETLAETILGKNIKTFVELSIVVFSIGCNVAYVIAVGDIMEKSHLLFHDSRNWTMILAWLVAMMPLSMFPKMQHFQFASACGIASIGTLVFSTAVHLLQDLSGNGYDNELYAHKSGSTTTHTLLKVLYTCLWPANGLNSVLTACPIILFAFSCQCNVCSIFLELPEKVVTRGSSSEQQPMQIPPSPAKDEKRVNNIAATVGRGVNVKDDVNTSPAIGTGIRLTRPPPAKRMSSLVSFLSSGGTVTTKDSIMHKVTVCSVCVCAVLYTAISFVSLADFGVDTEPNMLSNYRPVGVMQVAMSAMAVAVVLAFPLNVFPPRVTLHGWLIGTQFDRRFFGSSSDAIPVNNGDEPVETQRLLDDTIEHGAKGHGAVEHRSHMFTRIVPTVLHDVRYDMPKIKSVVEFEEDDDENPHFNWNRHIFLTLLLTILSLSFALVVPDISVVFGLLGGTAASFVGFCVPGLLGLHLEKDLYGDENKPSSNTTLEESNQQRPQHVINKNVKSTICSSRKRLAIVSRTLLFGGVCVAILTTIVTFYNTFVDPENDR